MPTKLIRGITLAYDDLRPTAAKSTVSANPASVLVFIHGHPFNRSMWAEQIKHFQNNYRLLLPDLRGYGESDVTTPRVLLDEMALDILHLLDELGIEKASFIGLSMGGQIVLDLWRLNPHRFNAMVIVDSDARAETPESAARRITTAEEIQKTGMIKHTDETIHKYIAKTSMANPNVYDPLYKMMTTTNPEGAAAAHKGRALRRDHTAILPKINVPSLIVVGTEDFFTPIPIARLMSDKIPGAQLAVIAGAGHLPNMEAPEEFNRQLEGFLKGQA
jgi:pimeloyl-ACP methyl ester carboxylesterase